MNEFNKPTWTVITKSKTILPTESSPQSSVQLTPVHSSSSSDFQLSSLSSEIPSLTPTVSDYSGETSSTYLASSDVLTSYPPIESSFHTVNLQTPSSSDALHTPSASITDLDTTFPNVISSTPSVPFSSIPFNSVSDTMFDSSELNSNQFNSDSIDRTDYETISATSPIHPTHTFHPPVTTVHFNGTDDLNHTTPLPDFNEPQLHKTGNNCPPLDR